MANNYDLYAFAPESWTFAAFGVAVFVAAIAIAALVIWWRH